MLRSLGKTGLEIAPLVFGGNVLGWTIDEKTSFQVLDAFVDHGFNAIDTADVYSAWAAGNKGGESETIIGKWLKGRAGMRDKVTIFTKVGSDLGVPGKKGLSEKWILQAIDESLTRLGVGEIDLYFSHWPDPETSYEETLGAYDKLLKAGKVRAIGDAERAVRAELELISGVVALKTHVPIQTRVGIATSTGLVVVGDLIGSGASQEQAIVGETPNLAARLQGIAGSNSVVIAESTRKLLGNLFELEDLGPQELKGVSEPVRAWDALRPSVVESRFEALHSGGLTELVGREEELELLLRRWSKTKAREGQVVLLSGEPGIGKSRLTAAVLERLAAEPQTRLRYFCSPQHTDSALYPIISRMERAAAFTHDDNTQAKLDK